MILVVVIRMRAMIPRESMILNIMVENTNGKLSSDGNKDSYRIGNATKSQAFPKIQLGL